MNTAVVVDVTAVGNASGCGVSGGGYTIFADNGAGGGIEGDGVRNGNEAVLRTVSLPTGGGPCISMRETSPAGQPIGFTARGLPLAGMEVFVDSNGNEVVGSIQVANTKTGRKLSSSIRLAGSIFTQTP